MSQLDALTRFLAENMPTRAMQGFDSQMDGVEFIPAQRDLGLNQYRLAIIKYNAVLSWERYPYREYDPKILMALFIAWLAQADRSLFEEIGIDNDLPDFDIDVIDPETAIVVVSLPMAEELNLVPDENGSIPHDGRRWRLESPEIWTAEAAEVIPHREDSL
ncbi:phage tail protein [Jejubacter calystegiae]|uniref:Phage tail protein n=1 Tax=Jejubacter calystegiae TaxID=2579935 RepID=A0A4P8YDD2_9ENTR|nr:phage tail protein [Jejubacter calystegiae]QCT18489.1 phage tail protein [Jejubacter calystegiae]